MGGSRSAGFDFERRGVFALRAVAASTCRLNNRGTDIEFSAFNFGVPGRSNRPITAADAGDGFLERQGYAYVDAGWECDVVPNPTTNNFAPSCPIATQPDGSPIIGQMRIEYHDEPAGTFSLPLEGSPAFHSYEAADTNTAHSTLTIRDEESASRVPLPSSALTFGDAIPVLTLPCQDGTDSSNPASSSGESRANLSLLVTAPIIAKHDTRRVVTCLSR